MVINSVEEKSYSYQTTASASNYGSGISKGFLMSLQDQMAGWIKAIGDQKLTSNEVSAIEQGASFADLNSVEDPGISNPLYQDSAAYLYASTKINDVQNTVTFLFNAYSVEKQMLDKVLSMMTG